MKIGLFFGSFNPIHVGHLIIANTMATTTDLEQVWFIVSPQNPFKKNNSLLHEFDRFDLVQRAISDNTLLRANDIEFTCPSRATRSIRSCACRRNFRSTSLN